MFTKTDSEALMWAFFFLRTFNFTGQIIETAKAIKNNVLQVSGYYFLYLREALK